jgi:transmembrane sensor
VAGPEDSAHPKPQGPAALDWFVRLREDGSPRERRAFERWLEADPSNQGAYADVETMWGRLHAAGGLLLAQEERELRSLLAAMDATRKARSSNTIVASIAGMLCLLVLAGSIWLKRPNLLEDLRADYVAARGQQRTLVLPDGSTALIDADSALALKFSADDRRVVLLRGAAFFSVVHTGEPFEVEAAGGEERVLGTKFSVRIEGDGAAVTVAEGKVAVSLPGFALATLTAGEQATYGPSASARRSPSILIRRWRGSTDC